MPTAERQRDTLAWRHAVAAALSTRHSRLHSEPPPFCVQGGMPGAAHLLTSRHAVAAALPALHSRQRSHPPHPPLYVQGGMPGAEHLRDSDALARMTERQRDAGKLYAAICASPVVFLQSRGLLDGKKATAHPAFSGKLTDPR